jgi:flagellar protein FlgJ
MAVVDRSRVDPQIVKAAEGMETMFMDYMMKVMRQTVPKNDLDLESPATDIYRSMLDSEYAAKAVKAGGVGLADQIVAYLEAQRYNPMNGPAAPAAGVPPTQAASAPGAPSASTGGTRHEGQPSR